QQLGRLERAGGCLDALRTVVGRFGACKLTFAVDHGPSSVRDRRAMVRNPTQLPKPTHAGHARRRLPSLPKHPDAVPARRRALLASGREVSSTRFDGLNTCQVMRLLAAGVRGPVLRDECLQPRRFRPDLQLLHPITGRLLVIVEVYFGHTVSREKARYYEQLD